MHVRFITSYTAVIIPPHVLVEIYIARIIKICSSQNFNLKRQFSNHTMKLNLSTVNPARVCYITSKSLNKTSTKIYSYTKCIRANAYFINLTRLTPRQSEHVVLCCFSFPIFQ